MVPSSYLFSQAEAKSPLVKIIQFPLFRIVLSVLFIGPFLLFHNNILADIIASSTGGLHNVLSIFDTVLSIAIIFFLYRLYTRVIEKRQAHELSLKKSWIEMGSGFLISLGIVGILVLLMTVLGYYRVDFLNPPDTLLEGIFYFGMGSFIQVLAFRLILFRLVEEFLGTWGSFFLVAAVFAVVHIANPNAGFGSTVSLVLGDVLLAAAFIYTRRIWLVWGIHLGWNFFQDGVFGMPNSGITELVSWIQPEINGPEWITGGNFGVEMSFLAIAISLAIGLLIFKKAIEKKQIVLPAWKRQGREG